MPDGGRWGEHVDFTPGWHRVGEAVKTAVKSPAVWVPLTGAAAFQIDHWDRHLSDWAVDHTPLFGSEGSADNASTVLKSIACLGYAASVVATPGGDRGPDWLMTKAKGALVGVSAIAATEFTTGTLKVAVGRERPNGVNDNSFPSDHTSGAAVCDRLTSRNLDDIPMDDRLRLALQLGTEGVTIATAWARVEAGVHYPSDVLFGMALGNFFGIAFDEAFMGDEETRPRVSLSIAPLRGGGEARWDVQF